MPGINATPQYPGLLPDIVPVQEKLPLGCCSFCGTTTPLPSPATLPAAAIGGVSRRAGCLAGTQNDVHGETRRDVGSCQVVGEGGGTHDNMAGVPDRGWLGVRLAPRLAP